MAYSITPSPRWSRYSDTHKGYPIRFRIKIGATPAFFEPTDLYVATRGQWDTKAKKVQKHREAEAINTALDVKRLELRKRIISEQAEGQEISRESIKGKSIASLFKYAREVRGDNDTTNCILTRIQKLCGREPRIGEITPEWLRKLENKMRTEPIPEGNKRKGRLKKADKAKKRYADNTINSTMKLLRRVHNQALIEGYASKKVTGKGLYEVPGPGKTLPKFLIRDERERWLRGMIDHRFKDDPEMHMVLVYFMLGCYAGLRRSDWYKFDIDQKIIGDRIVLLTHKTEGLVSYKINRSLQLVLDEIRRLGPLTINRNKLQNLLNKINKCEYFKLKKRPTSHTARHSFGRFMAEERVLETTCAWFMGIGVNMVKIYYHITNDDRNTHIEHLADR